MMPDSIRLGLMPPLTGLVEIYGPEIVWATRILRDLTGEVSGHDFTPWQRRQISFLELTDDARTCYAYITAYASSQTV